jgi:hypothetical protein
MPKRQEAVMQDKAERHAAPSGRWTWTGAALGAVHGALAARYPWDGEAVFFNLGYAVTNALVVALLARGVCWLWLREGARRAPR